VSGTVLLQALLSGLTNGAIYALVAVGLTLVFGVMRVVNFAHGEFLMIGMYGGYFAWAWLGLDPVLSIVIVTPVLMLLGVALFEGLIRPAIHVPEINQMAVTLGLSLLLQYLALVVFKADNYVVTQDRSTASVWLGPALLQLPHAIAAAASLILLAVFYVILRKTDFGLVMRAVSQSRDGAALSGIDIGRTYRWAMAVGIGTLGVAGPLLVSVLYANPHVGALFTLKAFVIVIVGGMGSFGGVLLGAMLVGLAESVAAAWLTASVAAAVPFALLILVMLIRPEGLLPVGGARRYLPALVPSFLAAAAFLASLTDPYYMDVYILAAMMGTLGVAWNLMAGFTGLVSLGHALFFGIGAYTVAYGQIGLKLGPLATWPLAMALAVGASLLIGLLCFRYGLRGYFFSIATLAFSEVAFSLVSATLILGRSDGLMMPGMDEPLRYLQFENKWPYGLIILAILTGTLFTGQAVLSSRPGAYWRAIRDNEGAAEALGVPALRYKLLAFALSAGVTAIGGAFFASCFNFVDPRSTLGVELSIQLLVFAIIGGLGLLWGPLLGAALLIPAGEVLRTTLGASFTGINIVAYALLLVVLALVLPHGLGGLLAARFRRHPSSIGPRA
jgi:branched-subunit amino acid ABC-type transport system permease component